MNTKLLAVQVQPTSGSGGKPIDAVTGCDGYGLPITLQQTDTSSPDPMGDYVTSFQTDVPLTYEPPVPSAGAFPPTIYATGGGSYEAGFSPDGTAIGGGAICKGFTATAGGVPGINYQLAGIPNTPPADYPYFLSNFPQVGTCIMWETAPGECDNYTCPAGTWYVQCLSESAGDPTVPNGMVWTGVVIARVNAAGVVQEQISMIPEIVNETTRIPLTFAPAAAPFDLSYNGDTNNATNTQLHFGQIDEATGILTAAVPGIATTFAVGDKVVILLVFQYIYPPGTCPAQDAATSGSGSGGSYIPCKDGMILRSGVIRTPMIDKRARYMGLVLPKEYWVNPNKPTVVITRNCGPYRIVKKVASGKFFAEDERTYDRWAFADCCPPYNASGVAGPDYQWDGSYVTIPCVLGSGTGTSQIPSLLWASLGGALACYGTVPLIYNNPNIPLIFQQFIPPGQNWTFYLPNFCTSPSYTPPVVAGARMVPGINPGTLFLLNIGDTLTPVCSWLFGVTGRTIDAAEPNNFEYFSDTLFWGYGDNYGLFYYPPSSYSPFDWFVDDSEVSPANIPLGIFWTNYYYLAEFETLDGYAASSFHIFAP